MHNLTKINRCLTEIIYSEFLKLTTLSAWDGRKEKLRQHRIQQRKKTTKRRVKMGRVPATDTICPSLENRMYNKPWNDISYLWCYNYSFHRSEPQEIRICLLLRYNHQKYLCLPVLVILVLEVLSPSVIFSIFKIFFYLVTWEVIHKLFRLSWWLLIKWWSYFGFLYCVVDRFSDFPRLNI
jgi:hypothetical protein